MTGERQNLFLEFGLGKIVVALGTIGARHAVFISDASNPGVVGDSAERENHPTDRLRPGEIVFLFPTSEQAIAVADALCNQLQGGVNA